MKKIRKITMILSSISIILFGAWTFGAILYMAFVANYYRNTERRETSVQNHPSNRRTNNTPDCRNTSGLSPDTAKFLLADNYKPKTNIIQREATGELNGFRLK